jgi:hypothetical protein
MYRQLKIVPIVVSLFASCLAAPEGEFDQLETQQGDLTVGQTYRFRSQADTTKCLARDANFKLVLATCASVATQRWTASTASATFLGTTYVWPVIKVAGTNQCITENGVVGDAVYALAACQNSYGIRPIQTFTLDSSSRLVNTSSSGSICIRKSGSGVLDATCSTALDQKWTAIAP